MYRNRTDF